MFGQPESDFALKLIKIDLFTQLGPVDVGKLAEQDFSTYLNKCLALIENLPKNRMAQTPENKEKELIRANKIFQELKAVKSQSPIVIEFGAQIQEQAKAVGIALPSDFNEGEELLLEESQADVKSQAVGSAAEPEEFMPANWTPKTAVGPVNTVASELPGLGLFHQSELEACVQNPSLLDGFIRKLAGNIDRYVEKIFVELDLSPLSSPESEEFTNLYETLSCKMTALIESLCYVVASQDRANARFMILGALGRVSDILSNSGNIMAYQVVLNAVTNYKMGKFIESMDLSAKTIKAVQQISDLHMKNTSRMIKLQFQQADNLIPNLINLRTWFDPEKFPKNEHARAQAVQKIKTVIDRQKVTASARQTELAADDEFEAFDKVLTSEVAKCALNRANIALKKLLIGIESYGDLKNETSENMRGSFTKDIKEKSILLLPALVVAGDNLIDEDSQALITELKNIAQDILDSRVEYNKAAIDKIKIQAEVEVRAKALSEASDKMDRAWQALVPKFTALASKLKSAGVTLSKLSQKHPSSDMRIAERSTLLKEQKSRYDKARRASSDKKKAKPGIKTRKENDIRKAIGKLNYSPQIDTHDEKVMGSKRVSFVRGVVPEDEISEDLITVTQQSGDLGPPPVTPPPRESARAAAVDEDSSEESSYTDDSDWSEGDEELLGEPPAVPMVQRVDLTEEASLEEVATGASAEEGTSPVEAALSDSVELLSQQINTADTTQARNDLIIKASALLAQAESLEEVESGLSGIEVDWAPIVDVVTQAVAVAESDPGVIERSLKQLKNNVLRKPGARDALEAIENQEAQQKVQQAIRELRFESLDDENRDNPQKFRFAAPEGLDPNILVGELSSQTGFGWAIDTVTHLILVDADILREKSGLSDSDIKSITRKSISEPQAKAKLTSEIPETVPQGIMQGSDVDDDIPAVKSKPGLLIRILRRLPFIGKRFRPKNEKPFTAEMLALASETDKYKAFFEESGSDDDIVDKSFIAETDSKTKKPFTADLLMSASETDEGEAWLDEGESDEVVIHEDFKVSPELESTQDNPSSILAEMPEIPGALEEIEFDYGPEVAALDNLDKIVTAMKPNKRFLRSTQYLSEDHQTALMQHAMKLAVKEYRLSPKSNAELAKKLQTIVKYATVDNPQLKLALEDLAVIMRGDLQLMKSDMENLDSESVKASLKNALEWRAELENMVKAREATQAKTAPPLPPKPVKDPVHRKAPLVPPKPTANLEVNFIENMNLADINGIKVISTKDSVKIYLNKDQPIDKIALAKSIMASILDAKVESGDTSKIQISGVDTELVEMMRQLAQTLSISDRFEFLGEQVLMPDQDFGTTETLERVAKKLPESDFPEPR